MRRAAVLALSALTACAAPPPAGPTLEQRWNARLGMLESDVVAGVGPPQSVYVASDGSRILTFSRSGTVQIGGYQQYQPVTSTTRGTVGSTPYTGTTTTWQNTTSPVETINLTCSVHAKFVQDHMVTWSASGNNCR